MPEGFSGEIPKTQEEWAEFVRLQRLRDEADAQADQQSQVEDPVSTISGEQSVRIAAMLEEAEERRKKEWREKMLSLTARDIVIDPEDPENSPDLRQVENIYTEALLPDEVLLALDNDQLSYYLEKIIEGGMLNRFDASVAEREKLPVGYESPKQQIIADLLRTSGRPGEFRMRGLFDANGILRAYLSYRTPPKKPTGTSMMTDYFRQRMEYAEYLEKILELTDEDLAPSVPGEGHTRTMHYKCSASKREDIRTKLPSTWEFDTINVQKGWGGAGLLLVNDVLDQIDAEFPNGEIEEAFVYRYNALSPKNTRRSSRGKNMKSSAFLEIKLGFEEMADRNDPDEIVAREMPDGSCHEYNPEWRYLRNEHQLLRSQVKHWILKQKLRG